MECYVCSKKLDKEYLCEQCVNLILKMLEANTHVISNPKWENHCLICGEYEDRVIIDVPNCGPICGKCLSEAKRIYV